MLTMTVADTFLKLVGLTNAAKIELLSTAYSNRVVTQELAIQSDWERADAIAQLERLGLVRVKPFPGKQYCMAYGVPADPDTKWLEISITPGGRLTFRKLKGLFFKFSSQSIELRKN